jgi:hypothetical protein
MAQAQPELIQYLNLLWQTAVAAETLEARRPQKDSPVVQVVAL